MQRDPLRVFYSTLREQMPDSEMAEVWWVPKTFVHSENAALLNVHYV